MVNGPRSMEAAEEEYADEYEDDFEDSDGEEEQKRGGGADPADAGGDPGDGAASMKALSLPEITVEELGELGEQLGGGGVSVVFRAVWGGRPVAVKLTQDGQVTERLTEEYRNELLVMGTLDHPNIIRVLGASLAPPRLCIVMELCGPSLHRLLHQTAEAHFDHIRRMQVARDVAEALRYLHAFEVPVIHRDIKSANVVVDELTGQCKLIDFGLASSRVVSAGTPSYMSPELLAGATYNASVDVYAFGVLLWELFAQQMPFDGYDIPTVKAKVIGGERPAIPLSTPRVVQRLFSECWHQEVGERPSFAEVVPRLESCEGALCAHQAPLLLDGLLCEDVEAERACVAQACGGVHERRCCGRRRRWFGRYALRRQQLGRRQQPGYGRLRRLPGFPHVTEVILWRPGGRRRKGGGGVEWRYQTSSISSSQTSRSSIRGVSDWGRQRRWR